MKRITKVLLIAVLIVSITAPLYLIHYVRNTGLGYGVGTVGTKDAVSIANELCEGLTSDWEKMVAIHDWIAHEIHYEDRPDAIYQYYDEMKLLKTRRGLCFDYANLFASMCRSQGIPCHLLDGYKRNDPTALHTWNRVCIDSCWWNIDVTYDSEALRLNCPLYGYLKVGADCDLPDERYVITKIY